MWEVKWIGGILRGDSSRDEKISVLRVVCYIYIIYIIVFVVVIYIIYIMFPILLFISPTLKIIFFWNFKQCVYLCSCTHDYSAHRG